MRIGLGTAAIGRPQYINIKSQEESKFDLETFKSNGIKMLDAAYDLGIRYFDTAPGYGIAENLLINWKRRRDSHKIRIGTKWGYTYVANFDPNAAVHEIKEHSLSKLNEQWAVSNVFKPNLDYYQIHSATLDTGVFDNDQVLNKLASLKETNGIKVGITSSGDDQLKILEKALAVKINGSDLFDTFQVTYNVLDQSLHRKLISLQQIGKTIIVKEALANGRLFRNDDYKHYSKLYNYSEFLADKYKVGVDAIFLKFCLQTLPTSIVLSGASQVDQLKSNLKANSFKLTNTELVSLKKFKSNPTAYWNERKALGWN